MLNTETVKNNLKNLEIELPEPSSAVANYTAWQKMGSLLIVSGQLPFSNGKIFHPGIVGESVTLDIGYQAARLCGINILAQVSHAVDGDWSKVVKCVRLGGFVAALPDYTDHPKVINGASDLMVNILGECGRHARAAVGVSSLPLGACVEVEATFELRS